jgi:hypothetical protein
MEADLFSTASLREPSSPSAIYLDPQPLPLAARGCGRDKLNRFDAAFAAATDNRPAKVFDYRFCALNFVFARSRKSVAHA